MASTFHPAARAAPIGRAAGLLAAVAAALALVPARGLAQEPPIKALWVEEEAAKEALAAEETPAVEETPAAEGNPTAEGNPAVEEPAAAPRDAGARLTEPRPDRVDPRVLDTSAPLEEPNSAAAAYVLLGPLGTLVGGVGGGLVGSDIGFGALDSIGAGVLFTVVGVVSGAGLGAWSAGEILGLDGSLGWSIVGSLVGLGVPMVCLSIADGAHPSEEAVALMATTSVLATLSMPSLFYWASTPDESGSRLTAQPSVVPLERGAMFGLTIGGF